MIQNSWFFRIALRSILLLVLGILLWNPKPISADVYRQLGIYDAGVKILKSPENFFQGFQYEIENLSPSFFKKHLPPEWVEISENSYDNVSPYTFYKRMSISTSLTGFVWSIANYHIKGHVLQEAIYLPQITLGFGHNFYIPIYKGAAANNDEKNFLENIEFMAFSFDIILSKSVASRIKLFGGYRFSYGQLKWNIPQLIATQYNVAPTIGKEFDWKLNDLIFGINYLFAYSKWETSSYLGFDPNLFSIFVKWEFAHRFIGIGVGYYPNNIIKIRPYFRLFYDFI